jgi:hypothetical protein
MTSGDDRQNCHIQQLIEPGPHIGVRDHQQNHRPSKRQVIRVNAPPASRRQHFDHCERQEHPDGLEYSDIW